MAWCAPGTLPRGEPTSLRSTTAPRSRPWPTTPPARPWPQAAWIARFGSGPPHPAGGAWGRCPTRTSSRASPSAPTAGSWREAAAQRTREAAILIWDASSGTISAKVECPRGVDCLSFSSDSRRIATCGSDAVVQVWDATGGHETLSLDGHGGRVSAVLFAPRDLRLYSAGRDGVVKLWDGSTTAPAE